MEKKKLVHIYCKPVYVDCVNRFEPVTSQKASSSSSSETSGSLCSGENID